MCKLYEFAFVFRVHSVKSLSGWFPLISISTHAQGSAQLRGFPSLVCLQMLSVEASLISMHWWKWYIFGKTTKKNIEVCLLCQKFDVIATKLSRLTSLKHKHKLTQFNFSSLCVAGRRSERTEMFFCVSWLTDGFICVSVEDVRTPNILYLCDVELFPWATDSVVGLSVNKLLILILNCYICT